MWVYLCLLLSGLTCNWLYMFTYAYNLAIYFDTMGVPNMQFLELICINDIDMDNLGTNLDQILLVPSIAEISPRFF